MKHKEFALKTTDNLILYGQCWVPEPQPKAVVALIHGIGEHSSRYVHWAERFNANGVAFAGFDLRGHGNSEGKRGHIPSYRKLLEDVDIYLEQISGYFPGLPLFLYGHSMGGNIVLNYAAQKKPAVSGIIVSSPWLRLHKELPAWVNGILRPLRSLFPGLTISSGLDTSAISRDESVVETYRTDPLVHGRISFQLYFEMHDAANRLMTMRDNLCCPVLLMHSRDDQICACNASKSFAEKNEQVTLKTWEGLYHELHNEPEKDEVFSAVYEWLEHLLQKKS